MKTISFFAPKTGTLPEVRLHRQRVLDLGGTNVVDSVVEKCYRFILDQGRELDTLSWIAPAFGVVKNASQKVSRVFSIYHGRDAVATNGPIYSLSANGIAELVFNASQQNSIQIPSLGIAGHSELTASFVLGLTGGIPELCILELSPRINNTVSFACFIADNGYNWCYYISDGGGFCIPTTPSTYVANKYESHVMYGKFNGPNSLNTLFNGQPLNNYVLNHNLSPGSTFTVNDVLNIGARNGTDFFSSQIAKSYCFLKTTSNLEQAQALHNFQVATFGL